VNQLIFSVSFLATETLLETENFPQNEFYLFHVDHHVIFVTDNI